MLKYFKFRLARPYDYSYHVVFDFSNYMRKTRIVTRATPGKLLFRFAFPTGVSHGTYHDIYHGEDKEGKYVRGRVLDVWWHKGFHIGFTRWTAGVHA